MDKSIRQQSNTLYYVGSSLVSVYLGSRLLAARTKHACAGRCWSLEAVVKGRYAAVGMGEAEADRSSEKRQAPRSACDRPRGSSRRGRCRHCIWRVLSALCAFCRSAGHRHCRGHRRLGGHDVDGAFGDHHLKHTCRLCSLLSFTSPFDMLPCNISGAQP